MNICAFQALSDPTRRRVLETLRHGEQPVNDIVSELAIRQSGVSRHLRILLNAGFVSVRAEGQRRLYSLRPEPFREVEAWLSSYRQIWAARLERFGAALDEKQARRTAQKPHQKRKVR
jgi:DNA-binding transcriptional ArsR family regulator